MTRIITVVSLSVALFTQALVGSDLMDYEIKLSAVKSSERDDAYEVLFGANADAKFWSHFRSPHTARAEIIALLELARKNGDEDAKKACAILMEVFPR